MNCENGRVVGIEENFAWVETVQNSTCTSCSAKSGCGQRLLNSVFQGKRHYIKVSTESFEQALSVNDEVELIVDDNVLLIGSAWIYCLPLVAIIAGALLAGKYFEITSNFFTAQQAADLPAVLGALAGFAVAFVIVAVHGHWQRNNPKFQPRLSRVLQSSSLASAVIIKAL